MHATDAGSSASKKGRQQLREVRGRRENALLQSMAEDAEAKALRLAAAEGLTLVRSNNKTGFSNVYPVQGSLAGLVRVEVGSTAGGKREHLGSFATAAEAALAYARYLGPERSRALAERPRSKPPRRRDAHEFGQPRIPSSTSHEVACVAADDDDYDESRPRARAGTGAAHSAEGRGRRTRSRGADMEWQQRLQAVRKQTNGDKQAVARR